MITSYINGFKNTLKNRRMVAVVYLSTVLLGLLIAIPFFGFAKTNFSDTLQIRDLLKDFDYTAYSDFTSNFRESIPIFTSLIKWFGFGYIFFSVFLSGGIISKFVKENSQYSVKSFLGDCGCYFFRFFRLSLYLLIAQTIFFAIIAIPYSILISSLVDSVNSETTLVYTTIVFLASYLLIFLLFVAIGDYAKISIVDNNSKKVLKTFWDSFKFVLSNLSAYVLYIFTFIFPIIILLLYLFLESTIGMTSGLTIVIMIFIQQIFIFGRIFGKVWILASAANYSSLLVIKKNEVNELNDDDSDSKNEINIPQVSTES